MDSDLQKWWYSKPKIDRHFVDAVEMSRGGARGLARLHADGHIHRDYSLYNMFCLQGGSLGALLGDFGKTIYATTDTFPELGPKWLKAPEIDGKTPYDKSIDIYAFGMSLAELAFVQVCTAAFGFNPNGAQTREWFDKVCRLFDGHLLDSDIHMAMLPIIQDMINPDPARRPTAAWLVKYWPRYQPPRPARKSIPSAGRPSAKRGKIDIHGGKVGTGK